MNGLVSMMNSKGWSFIDNGDDKFVVFSNAFHFQEPILVVFPKDDTLIDFPSQLLCSLQTLVNIDNELRKQWVIKELRALASNIKGKYSKDKSKWILREPHSKYKNNEIPDIYIPLN